MPFFALALYAQAAQPEAGSGELSTNTDIVTLLVDASPLAKAVLLILLLFSAISCMCTATFSSSVRGSVQSGCPISGRTGTSQSGSFASAWCQTKIIPLASETGHARSRAAGGMRSQYGIETQLPRPSKRQPWKGHRSVSPTTRPPSARCAPRCGQ